MDKALYKKTFNNDAYEKSNAICSVGTVTSQWVGLPRNYGLIPSRVKYLDQLQDPSSLLFDGKSGFFPQE